MKYAAILLGLALCSSAKADEITTGDLAFSCSPACPAVIAGAEQIAPTSGSFSYDDTTGHFLAMNIVWDGIQFTFNGPAILYAGDGTQIPTNEPAIYQGLLGAGVQWVAQCGGFSLAPCDQLGFLVGMFSAPNYLGFTAGFPLQPTFSEAASGGLVTATNLDPIFTPEPGTLLLFVSGLIVVWLALMRPRKPTNRQRYEAFCSHPFRKG